MMRGLVWLGIGYLALVLQLSLLPLVLPAEWLPDLTLVLVIALGLIEPVVPGMVLACLLGVLRDVFSATTMGLYGFVFGVLYLCLRGVSGKLNYDSLLLYPAMVTLATLLQTVLIWLCLWLLSDLEPIGTTLLAPLPRELPANALAALVLAGPVMRRARGERPYED